MKSFQPRNLVSLKVLLLFCYLYILFRANSLIILRIPYQHFDNNTKIFCVLSISRSLRFRIGFIRQKTQQNSRCLEHERENVIVRGIHFIDM